MKVTILVLFVFVGLWLALLSYLTGTFTFKLLPVQIGNLPLPKNTTELGDSLAILDGLFSSIAIVLGMIAIIFQGRELKESTQAQAEQASALYLQISQQHDANLQATRTARLQYLLSECLRMGADIDRIRNEIPNISNDEAKKIKNDILTNTINKRRRYSKEANGINEDLRSMHA